MLPRPVVCTALSGWQNQTCGRSFQPIAYLLRCLGSSLLRTLLLLQRPPLNLGHSFLILVSFHCPRCRLFTSLLLLLFLLLLRRGLLLLFVLVLLCCLHGASSSSSRSSSSNLGSFSTAWSRRHRHSWM